MSIDAVSIKKLWSLSGGLCGYPECQENCVKFLDSSTYLIGEMAHVIAKSSDGPRGITGGGADTYDNLILLCPTHHTMIDKSPEGTYSVETIHQWKKEHELFVNQRLSLPKIKNKEELFTFIQKKLIENKTMWKTYGPESDSAKENPLSNLYLFWDYIKLQRIIPNNSIIVNAIKRSSDFLSADEYFVCYQFIIHSEAFENNSYVRTENVPRFPTVFEELINGNK